MSSFEQGKERGVRRLSIGRARTDVTAGGAAEVPSREPALDLRALYSAELEELKGELRRTYLDDLKREALTTAEAELERQKKKLQNELSLKEKRLERELEAVQAVFNRFEEQCQTFEPELDHAVVELTLECLYQLAGHKETYRTLIEDIVRNAITKIGVDRHPVVRLSRADFDLIGTKIQAIEGCDCQHDDSLTVSEVQVDCRYTRYDANLVSQLDALRDALISSLAKHG